MKHTTEQQQARRELLAVLELLLGNRTGPANPETLEPLHNAAIACREYLQAELAADTKASERPRPEQITLDTWLGQETGRLISNTVAAYDMPHVEVIQTTVSHLIAAAVMYGATAVAARLEAEQGPVFVDYSERGMKGGKQRG